MISPKEIYEKFTNGDHLTYDQLEFGAKHFGTAGMALTVSGPTFHLAARECLRVSDTLGLYAANRRMEAKSEDRASEAYRDGYSTGIVWTFAYRPGGPFVMHADHMSKPEFKQLCEDSQTASRRWLMGFDEGWMAKKAGHQPDASIISCDASVVHEHSIGCLVSHR